MKLINIYSCIYIFYKLQVQFTVSIMLEVIMQLISTEINFYFSFEDKRIVNLLLIAGI